MNGVFGSVFLKRFGTVLSGASVGQVVSFLFAPLFAFLYSPEDIGVFGLFSGICMTIGNVASLRYEQAILLAENENDADFLSVYSVLMLFFLSILSGFLCFVVPLYHDEMKLAMHPLVWAFSGAAIVVLSGLFRVLQSRLTRESKYKEFSACEAVRSGSVIPIQAALYFFGVAGLVLGQILSMFLSCVFIIFYNRVFFGVFVSSIFDGQIKRHLYLLKKFSKFALLNTSKDLLNSTAANLPVFVFSAFGLTAASGVYVMTIRLMYRPLVLMTNPMRMVLFPHFAEKIRVHPESVLQFFLKSTLALMIPATALCLIFWFGSEFAVYWLLGEKWSDVIWQSNWLVPWVAIGVVNIPSVIASRVLRMEVSMSCYEVILTVFRAVVLVGGCFYWGEKGAIIGFSIVGILFNAGLILFVGVSIYRTRDKLSEVSF